MLLSAEHISKNYGDKQLLDDVTFYLEEGRKAGLIGLNGTGKSTFLKILAGRVAPDTGAVSTDPNVKISYLPQNSELRDDDAPLDADLRGRQRRFPRAGRIRSPRHAQPAERQRSSNSGSARCRAGSASASRWCAALVHPADVLILDEPTNHLDGDTLRMARAAAQAL